MTLLSTLITLISVVQLQAQTPIKDSIKQNGGNAKKEIKGLVLNSDKLTALPYTNIYVLHKNKGAISNEKGYFSIDNSNLDSSDTVYFQYIGYKTRKIRIGELDTTSVIYLKEEIINLSEALIFANAPDPESIVKKVIKQKDSNYKRTTSKRQTFIRERDITDIEKFKIDYKKSSIAELNPEMMKLVEEKIPKHSTSFDDFLGIVYLPENKDDSIKIKIDPIRKVSLKEKDIAELKQFETIFENIFSNTQEKEYWKIKSGIFGGKLDQNDEPKSDTLIETTMDSLNKNKGKLSNLGQKIQSQLDYSLLENKDKWEFLYKTGRYNYILAGGTSVNGEDVYIIDFTPKNSGIYVGRMYITTTTFALIRADYEYASGKTGRNINLLGIGFTETQFSGSIYFEKNENNYRLKYFSHKAVANISLDRSFAIIKKRKRILFDKNLEEFKIDINLALNTEESLEYFVLDEKLISNQIYSDFKQPESLETIYVDQFDDKLWSGYSIIEPTQQMKEYKKQKQDL